METTSLYSLESHLELVIEPVAGLWLERESGIGEFSNLIIILRRIGLDL